MHPTAPLSRTHHNGLIAACVQSQHDFRQLHGRPTKQAHTTAVQPNRSTQRRATSLPVSCLIRLDAAGRAPASVQKARQPYRSRPTCATTAITYTSPSNAHMHLIDPTICSCHAHAIEPCQQDGMIDATAGVSGRAWTCFATPLRHYATPHQGMVPYAGPFILRCGPCPCQALAVRQRRRSQA